MSRQRVDYDTVNWGGRDLVAVQYLADDYITLLDKRQARKLHRAGTVGIIAPDSWAVIQSKKGTGLNVDPAYIRT